MRIVAVTGAGISAPTGIATYRQRGSAWTNTDLERKSHASRYGNHLPELWQFWGGLRAQAYAAAPTAAHRALARPDVTVFTQNVDGLHHRAGGAAVELHGSITRTRCIRCNAVYDDATIPDAGTVPDCLVCGYKARTRVDTVLFGEQLLGRKVKLARRLFRDADVCLYVGTSGTVEPVASFVTWARNAHRVLINAQPWEHPNPAFHETIIGEADDIVPDLMERYE